MDSPLVTVMIPSYNHEKYIGEAIESVLSQTYHNIEILIADDGSTDGSVSVIKSFHDERIQFFEYPVNTCFQTWDILRDSAKGKYVTYLGSDDVMEIDKIEKQVSILENNKEYQACFSWAKGIDADSRILTDGSTEACFNVENRSREAWLYQLTRSNNCLVAPSMMMNRMVFLSLDGFQMSYRQIPDWDLWIRFLLENQLYVIPEALVRYRVHTEGINANVSMVSEENSIRINYEHAHMISSIIVNMDPGLFCNIYRNELHDKNAKEFEEVLCEKFFWLTEHFNAEVQTQGIFFYFNHMHDRSFTGCLETKYGFKRQDFFALEVERGCAKAVHDAEKYAKECEEMAEKAISYLESVTGENNINAAD